MLRARLLGLLSLYRGSLTLSTNLFHLPSPFAWQVNKCCQPTWKTVTTTTECQDKASPPDPALISQPGTSPLLLTTHTHPATKPPPPSTLSHHTPPVSSEAGDYEVNVSGLAFTGSGSRDLRLSASLTPAPSPAALAGCGALQGLSGVTLNQT